MDIPYLLPPRSGIRNTIHCGDCLDVMYWLWRQGVQVTLRDFRHPYTDATFGPMMREASLSGALRNAVA